MTKNEHKILIVQVNATESTHFKNNIAYRLELIVRYLIDTVIEITTMLLWSLKKSDKKLMKNVRVVLLYAI